LADVRFDESAEETVKSFSPDEQKEVDWAVSLLADDDERQARAFDLSLIEQGFPVWAFVVPPVFLAFVESGPDEITVVHAHMVSGFGYARGGW